MRGLARPCSRRLTAENWDIIIARFSCEPIGFLALSRDEAVLAQPSIAPDWQGSGIGALLMAVAKQWLRNGFTLACDAANLGARRLYERHGLVLEQIAGGRAHYRWTPSA